MKRDAGLTSLAAAIQSEDTVLALEALSSLIELRHAEFSSPVLGQAVRARLGDASPEVRQAAARALRHVGPDAADVDTLLDLLARFPEDSELLGVAIAMSRRVEGRLAGAWLSAFEVADAGGRLRLVRYLDSCWVDGPVETAAVRGFREARDDTRHADWYGALGSFTPTREARVRLIFEMERQGDWSGIAHIHRKRFEEALGRSRLAPSAAPLAADYAIELLNAPPDAQVVSLCLDVLKDHGTARNAPALRDYASNPMVARTTRQLAARIAEELERRP